MCFRIAFWQGARGPKTGDNDLTWNSCGLPSAKCSNIDQFPLCLL
jgi:hypothetical protein